MPQPKESSSIRVIIVMGVAGAGKTTIGSALAASLGWRFLDADDVHSAENVTRMRDGIPLTDADRAPWLAALRGAIGAMLAAGARTVVACSALKETYRTALVADDWADAVRFVFLHAGEALVRDRLAVREGHYAGVSIADSQFRALEEPAGALRIEAGEKPMAIVAAIRSAFDL